MSKSKQTIFQTLHQCWMLAPHRLRRWWWVLAALSFVNAVVEVIAAMGMMVLMVNLAGSTLPRLPGGNSILAALSGTQSPGGLRTLCVVLAGIFAVKYLVASAIVMFEIRLPLIVGDDVVGRLFQLYVSAPYEFHIRRNSAETIRNLTAAMGVFYRVVAPSALSIVTESVSMLAIIALLLVAAPKQTITVGFIALVSSVSLYRLFQERLLFWGRRQKDLSKDGLMHVQQSLHGIKDIRITGSEDFFVQRYKEIRKLISQALIQETQYQEIPKVVLEACFIGLVLVAVVVFSYRSETAANFPLLGLFAYSGLRIFPSVSRILKAVQMIRSSGPAAADVFTDYSELARQSAPALLGSPSPGTRDDDAEIEMEQISFTYEGALQPALKDISTRILHGEVVAFVGLSGAGKSTLVNVLLGLFTPQQGTIRFNGLDIRDDLRGWQSHIGYVPQSPFILDDTLCRNVAFGVPDSDVDVDRVQRALQQARLAEMPDTLANGLHTRLGENGIRLSGGEKQRVAIARALYNDPAIIVFDEATSAIDNITERYITGAIESMRGERTVIIITHQLKLTHICDKIIFLDGGRVVASGAFAELHREHAEFRALLK